MHYGDYTRSLKDVILCLSVKSVISCSLSNLNSNRKLQVDEIHNFHRFRHWNQNSWDLHKHQSKEYLYVRFNSACSNQYVSQEACVFSRLSMQEDTCQTAHSAVTSNCAFVVLISAVTLDNFVNYCINGASGTFRFVLRKSVVWNKHLVQFIWADA